MKLLFASRNRHKREELSQIFENHEIVLPEDLGFRFDYEETGTTFLENALGKASHLFEQTGLKVVADDSGLVVPALGGEPGVYSARYGSVSGKELSVEERNGYLLSKMENVNNREAYFVCCMVFVSERYRFSAVQETFHGILTRVPSGTNGFGYDPLLFLPDYGCTVAELPMELKNRISHRGKAAAGLRRILDFQ